MIIVIVSPPQPPLPPQKLSQDHVTPLPMSGLLLADRPVSRSLIGLAASQVFIAYAPASQESVRSAHAL